jgi:hypothetical protein
VVKEGARTGSGIDRKLAGELRFSTGAADGIIYLFPDFRILLR